MVINITFTYLGLDRRQSTLRVVIYLCTLTLRVEACEINAWHSPIFFNMTNTSQNGWWKCFEIL